MDKLREDEAHWLYRRFSCECLHPGHILDVEIDKYGPGADAHRECCLHLYMVGKSDLKWRLKQAWNALRGREVDMVDFYVREEDIGHLADTILKADTTKYHEMH